jgi:uncharacterized protein (TIGR00106 family)
MAMMQITIIPSPPEEEGGTGVSGYVAKALEIIKSSSLKYELTPTATVVEGEIEELFTLGEKIHNKMFEYGAKRVVTLITIDDRRDNEIDMEYKKKAVLSKLDK